MSNFRNILVQGFHPFFRVLATSSFLLFCFLIILRVFEFSFLQLHGVIQTDDLSVILKSINYDLNACSLWFLVYCPCFLRVENGFC